MKKFIKNIFIFLIIFLALAYPLQWIIDTGLKKSDYSTEYKEWDDITQSRINADIIIMGSSKAWRHISPYEFEQAFKLSTYNLGMDGQCFRMEKWRFDVYNKYNKKPQYIIQIIGHSELDNPSADYNYTQFLPYFKEGYIERFGDHGFLNWKDFYIPLYKYTHNTGIMKAGLANLFNRTDSRKYKYKGFLPLNWHWSDSTFSCTKKKYPHGMKVDISPVTYADLINYIEYCKKENIKLILVDVPTYIGFQNLELNTNYVTNTYKSLAVKYGLKYLDYTKDTICRDTAMFYNSNHLNPRGVAIFNKQLINDLRDEIK